MANATGMMPGIVASGYLNPYQNVSQLSTAEFNNLSSRYRNMIGDQNEVGFGGVGMAPEYVNVMGASIPVPGAHATNRALGNVANHLNGNQGQSPFQVAGFGATGFTPAAGGVGSMGTGGIGTFVPGGGGTSFGAVLPNPSTPTGNGGFGNQTSHLFGVVAPKLAAKETALQNLRGKIAANETLSQNELLMYQDLMQQQNQLFMFAQNVFNSEHEKIKGWAQGLGRI